jgi:hypothetical protein
MASTSGWWPECGSGSDSEPEILTMDERTFWLEIRRAALNVARAIEQRYGLGPQEPRQPPASERREPTTARR